MMTVNEALKLWDYRGKSVALWYDSPFERGMKLLCLCSTHDSLLDRYKNLEFLAFIDCPQPSMKAVDNPSVINMKVKYSAEKKESNYKELWEELYKFVEEQAMKGLQTSYYTIWAFMDRAVSENVSEDTEYYPIETVLRAVRKIGKEYEADNAAAAVSFLLVTLGDLSRRGYETVLRANEKWYVIGVNKETAINFSGCIILNWLWSRNRLEEKE